MRAVAQVLGTVKPGRRLLLTSHRSPLPPPEAAWQADLVVGPADQRGGSRSPVPSPPLAQLLHDLGAWEPRILIASYHDDHQAPCLIFLIILGSISFQ